MDAFRHGGYYVILFAQSNLRNANDERELLEHMRNPQSRTHEFEVFSLKVATRVAAFIALLIYVRIFFRSINAHDERFFSRAA